MPAMFGHACPEHACYLNLKSLLDQCLRAEQRWESVQSFHKGMKTLPD